MLAVCSGVIHDRVTTRRKYNLNKNLVRKISELRNDSREHRLCKSSQVLLGWRKCDFSKRLKHIFDNIWETQKAHRSFPLYRTSSAKKHKKLNHTGANSKLSANWEICALPLWLAVTIITSPVRNQSPPGLICGVSHWLEIFELWKCVLTGYWGPQHAWACGNRACFALVSVPVHSQNGSPKGTFTGVVLWLIFSPVTAWRKYDWNRKTEPQSWLSAHRRKLELIAVPLFLLNEFFHDQEGNEWIKRYSFLKFSLDKMRSVLFLYNSKQPTPFKKSF